jgi:hypothetical protein
MSRCAGQAQSLRRSPRRSRSAVIRAGGVPNEREHLPGRSCFVGSCYDKGNRGSVGYDKIDEPVCLVEIDAGER